MLSPSQRPAEADLASPPPTNGRGSGAPTPQRKGKQGLTEGEAGPHEAKQLVLGHTACGIESGLKPWADWMGDSV